eukprot:CAMPEP_0178379532 /NCGR_PEP_ID=MMETSP0689_2-20121128/4991_1 /TAXON_ID=160604 /ORGANISM="Amphidinium massartii, Strain CS-259" /LENGTH=117 /DNA_ID=CAMNT_0019999637 /DNA_START=40 /DNA_END=389 /DNA_ORIENTATION=-
MGCTSSAIGNREMVESSPMKPYMRREVLKQQMATLSHGRDNDSLKELPISGVPSLTTAATDNNDLVDSDCGNGEDDDNQSLVSWDSDTESPFFPQARPKNQSSDATQRSGKEFVSLS